MEETQFIMFASQKGGVGKSTMTIIAANYLHFIKKRNVLIVDCDSPQFSIFNQRERETADLIHSATYKRKLMEQTESTGLKPVPIIKCEPTDVDKELERFIGSSAEAVDIAFFDICGSMNKISSVALAASAQFVFIPMQPDMSICSSELSLAALLNEKFMLVGQGNIKAIYLFWNKIDKRESKNIFERCVTTANTLGLPQMTAQLPFRSRYNKELGDGSFFKSTLIIPAESELREAGMIDFMEEFCEIIGIDN